MRPVTGEWVAKAEGDFDVMEREMRAHRKPNYDAACFHAQQCAEKYLKARLSDADIRFPSIHHLTVLLDLVLLKEPLWEAFREDLTLLTNYAVSYRYPGQAADRETALDARHRCRRFRRAAREALRLKA